MFKNPKIRSYLTAEAVLFLFHTIWDQYTFMPLNMPASLSKDFVEEYLKILIETTPDQKSYAIAVAKALNADYIDDSGLLEFFRDYVQNANRTSSFYSKDGKEEKYFAPLISLCQRSGSGKTRLLLELGRNHFPMIYISLGSVLKSPKKISDHLEQLVTLSGKRSEAERRAYFFIITLLEFVLVKYNMWFSQYHREADSEFFNYLVSLFQPTGDEQNEKDLESLWNNIIEKVAVNSKNPECNCDSIIKAYKSSKLPKLVISIDEAKKLLNDETVKESSSSPDDDEEVISAFRVLRRALSSLAKDVIEDGVVTLILADTYSKITNFAPVSKSDYSARFAAVNRKLIPPFFMLSGYDIMAKVYWKKCLELSDVNNMNDSSWWQFICERDSSPFEFIKLGSPLWGALMIYKNLRDNNVAIEAILEYAVTKLCGGQSLDIMEEHLIAALSARASLTIVPRSNLANELVAGSMGQLDLISSDRHSAFVSYPSDITLAQGASVIIMKHPVLALKALLNFTANSQISVGDGGEAMVELILLAAMDNLHHTFQSVLVKDFLVSLLGDVTGNPLLNCFTGKPILTGKIFFNHFIKLESSATEENLLYCFSRGAAISGYPMQPGWDMCIPVCLESGNFTAIFIQVKNYKEYLELSELRPMRGKMRLAGIQLLNPAKYETMWTGKKPKSSVLGNKVKAIDNEKNPDEMAIHIFINLLQGQPLSEEKVDPSSLPNQFANLSLPHLTTVETSHNFIAIQSFSLNAFPNFWGNSVEEKEACAETVKQLLLPRFDYSRQLEFENSALIVKTFNRFDHGHAIDSIVERAEHLNLN